MLNELHIENIAVIERADIEFSPGLNILTGETGAGKSIVIDSIGAVLGDRVSRDLIRSGADKASVTASFGITEEAASILREYDIECDDELIIQRRISADGKSSSRVCGIPVSTQQLRELTSTLIDIHGQNDGRRLTEERFHLDLLDRFGTLEESIKTYSSAFEAFRSLEKRIIELRLSEEDKERIRDRLKDRVEELESADLKPGEQDEIDSRLTLLRNAEKLSESVNTAYGLLQDNEFNALSLTQSAREQIRKASAFAPELSECVKSLSDAVFSLSDSLERISDLRDSLDFSEEEFDRLERRSAQINRLCRKYASTDDGLLKLLEESRAKLSEIDNADRVISELEQEFSDARERCRTLAASLSEKRKAAALELESKVVSELRDLSMRSVRFAVEFLPVENEYGFDSRGCDKVRFLMSANAGEAPGRISRIASGGELSRIMLAMKNALASNDPVPTMIFDEIDSGISGIAAQRVSEKLYQVSVGRQVMCVTHLPQIAAMADSHYVIVKNETDEKTCTDVLPLDMDGRIREIARLHGGENITQTTLAGALEQIRACEAYKDSL